MTDRYTYIERILRQIYGGQPSQDSEITINLVNEWLNDAVAIAAKQNYKENVQIEGIGYLNNSFYTTFKGLAITQDENFLYKATLPDIPLGIGRNEGVSNVRFKNSLNNVSYDGIPLSIAQKGYTRGQRIIPNKIEYYTEGGYLFAITAIIMTPYTAMVTMASAGDASDLDSIINVPSDYFNTIVAYIQQQLMLEKAQPQDTANDGRDNK